MGSWVRQLVLAYRTLRKRLPNVYAVAYRDQYPNRYRHGHYDTTERTFVMGELRRLLPEVDLDELPPFAPDPDAVYARGVALVEAAAKARRGRPPRPADDLDDPWGRADKYFARIADEIEATVQPLAKVLLT